MSHGVGHQAVGRHIHSAGYQYATNQRGAYPDELRPRPTTTDPRAGAGEVVWDLGTPGEKIDARGALQPASEAKDVGGELMNACAEPYGVSRSAGASRGCRPWYSAASESRRQRQFIAGLQGPMRLREGITTLSNQCGRNYLKDLLAPLHPCARFQGAITQPAFHLTSKSWNRRDRPRRGCEEAPGIARIGASLMSKDLGALSQAIPVRVGDQLRGAREWPCSGPLLHRFTRSTPLPIPSVPRMRASRSPAGRAFHPLSRVSARKQRIENQAKEQADRL